MDEYTEQNYIEKLRGLKMDVWSITSPQEKENLLQWIVSYHAHKLGLPPVCAVKIQELNGAFKNGEFDRETKVLSIQKELAIDCLKPPYNGRITGRDDILAHKAVFEVLMHEFRHAVQQYVFEHPYEFNNSSQFLIISINQEFGQHSNLRSYFQPSSSKNLDLRQNAEDLYFLQPQEVDACRFAENECLVFNALMHEMFPDDLSFIMSESKIKIEDQILDAKDTFNTETPEQDMADIIRYLNGLEPLNPLNPEMYDAVVTTQAKTREEKRLDRKSETDEYTINGKKLLAEWYEIGSEIDINRNSLEEQEVNIDSLSGDAIICNNNIMYQEDTEMQMDDVFGIDIEPR